jgi:uncharacterized protein YukE
MPSGFNVTAETLQADATRIATGADNIQGHLAFLQNAVSSVVNSGWVGTAAQSLPPCTRSSTRPVAT